MRLNCLHDYLLTIGFGCLSLFLLFLLFLFAFFFTLGHYEFIGGDALVNKVDVQCDQIGQQQYKHSIDSSRNPRSNKSFQEGTGFILQCQYQQGKHIQKKVGECCNYHAEEDAVVHPSNAIIDPHAVMIEVLHASIARSAVSRSFPHEAVTVIAEQQFDCTCLAELLEPAYPQAYSSREPLRYWIMTRSEGSHLPQMTVHPTSSKREMEYRTPNVACAGPESLGNTTLQKRTVSRRKTKQLATWGTPGRLVKLVFFSYSFGLPFIIIVHKVKPEKNKRKEI